MSGLTCFSIGCAGQEGCGHLRWLDTEDGMWVQQCSPACTLELVRPGKVQCDCEPNYWMGHAEPRFSRRGIEDVELP